MTKVEAVKQVMLANNGKATLQTIYNEAKKFKPDIENSDHWKAGIRGVLYREIRNGKTFAKLQDTLYGLKV